MDSILATVNNELVLPEDSNILGHLVTMRGFLKSFTLKQAYMLAQLFVKNGPVCRWCVTEQHSCNTTSQFLKGQDISDNTATG